jgi:hypothetical protein
MTHYIFPIQPAYQPAAIILISHIERNLREREREYAAAGIKIIFCSYLSHIMPHQNEKLIMESLTRMDTCLLVALYMLRLLCCFIYGYIHPDEFFQSGWS